jgi:hypothetical protein
MAPQEVAGLQAIAKAHGGSLTLNPDTGLPEAGFLSSILPLVAGAFLGPAGLGLTAMQAGMAAGALGTVATGSLKKGLMAGFGAYGGAGLAGSLVGAGAGAAQNAAMAAVDPAVGFTSGMGEVAAIEGAGVAGTNIPTMGSSALGSAAQTGSTLANPTGIPGFSGTGLGLTPAPSAVSAQQAVLQAAPQTFTPAPELTHQGMLNEAAARVTPGTELYKAAGTSPFDTAKAGFGELMKRPGDFMTKENLKYGLAGLSPVMADAMAPKTMAPRPVDKPYEYSFNYGRREDPQAGYTGAATGERTYFDPRFTSVAAGGGLMDVGPIEALSNRNQAETLMANGGQMFASGGISHLGDYSDGGRLLKGPGDGVSDSIPATIANKRPARLADGEFVVPARIVSELGNGSTEAGARKLYAMMDRVQKARKKSIGKNRVAVNSRAEKMLPA